MLSLDAVQREIRNVVPRNSPLNKPPPYTPSCDLIPDPPPYIPRQADSTPAIEQVSIYPNQNSTQTNHNSIRPLPGFRKE
ncbi:hypothetical protein HZS_1262 [Henneguya salminicola]|nr:hypothetical protein HZS_1262 [Henneguya salminicola]